MSTEYWQKPTPICCWQIKFCSNINFSSFSIETKTRGSQLGEGNNRKASRSHETRIVQCWHWCVYNFHGTYIKKVNIMFRKISLTSLTDLASRDTFLVFSYLERVGVDDWSSEMKVIFICRSVSAQSSCLHSEQENCPPASCPQSIHCIY